MTLTLFPALLMLVSGSIHAVVNALIKGRRQWLGTDDPVRPGGNADCGVRHSVCGAAAWGVGLAAGCCHGSRHLLHLLDQKRWRWVSFPLPIRCFRGMNPLITAFGSALLFPRTPWLDSAWRYRP